jgi:hypothetical protein
MGKGARLIDYRPSYDIFRMIEEGLALRRGETLDVVQAYARSNP